MKSEKNILIAFILNFAFSVFEFLGGIYTGSVAILSDAVHDAGDTLSIGLSFLLERKSKQKPDADYTYGYVRYSVLGSLVTTFILFIGSILVIIGAVSRILSPAKINYNGMLLLAIIGVIVNFLAVFFTRGGDSLNQKAVNLHMMEDVLGWAVVCIGAVIMKFTEFTLIDPLLSIGVAVFILVHVIKNFKEILSIFLERVPSNITLPEIRFHVENIDGVLDVHHMHIWSIDGQKGYATMHVVTDGDPHEIKAKIREKLQEFGILHVTLELESNKEFCNEKHCENQPRSTCRHHHHH